MKVDIFSAASRGASRTPWLTSYHSFAFSSYYNPQRTNFGALRVLNDDKVAPGKGFDTHPHSDMEIVSIPLVGSLRHEDTMGNQSVIRPGDVQIMSAGTGLKHAEYNNSDTESVEFLQIWIFSKEKGISPHYDQKTFDKASRKSAWQLAVSPGVPGSVLIHQEAYLSFCDLNAGQSLSYRLHGKHGVYLFVLKGSAVTGGEQLHARDAAGITGMDEFNITANTECELLAIEVPMDIPSFYKS